MLEDYLMRLEALITPTSYNKANFREKILADLEKKKKAMCSQITSMNNFIPPDEDNNHIIINGNDGKRKVINDYLSKMGIGQVENSRELFESQSGTLDKKLEGQFEILEQKENMKSNARLTSSRINANKTSRAQTISPGKRIRGGQKDYATEDIPSLCDKIHKINIKNMTYRYEVEKMKNKIAELNKVISDQSETIKKLEIQNDSSNQYLIKLENIIANNQVSFKKPGNNVGNWNLMGGATKKSSKASSSSNIINIQSNPVMNEKNYQVDIKSSNNITIEDKLNRTSVNISDKNELKEFISGLLSENRNLKMFQKQVFELSKQYDDINENMLESIRAIQNMMIDNVNKNAKIEEIIGNLDKFIENIHSAFEAKQQEYKFLLEYKEQESNILQEELLKINSEMELIKRDRLKDQKIITDYETQKDALLKIINSRENGIHNPKEENALKMEKKIEPVKKAVSKIINNIEKTFDLQDRNNIKMLCNITKNIK